MFELMYSFEDSQGNKVLESSIKLKGERCEYTFSSIIHAVAWELEERHIDTSTGYICVEDQRVQH